MLPNLLFHPLLNQNSFVNHPHPLFFFVSFFACMRWDSFLFPSSPPNLIQSSLESSSGRYESTTVSSSTNRSSPSNVSYFPAGFTRTDARLTEDVRSYSEMGPFIRRFFSCYIRLRWKSSMARRTCDLSEFLFIKSINSGFLYVWDQLKRATL